MSDKGNSFLKSTQNSPSRSTKSSPSRSTKSSPVVSPLTAIRELPNDISGILKDKLSDSLKNHPTPNYETVRHDIKYSTISKAHLALFKTKYDFSRQNARLILDFVSKTFANFTIIQLMHNRTMANFVKFIMTQYDDDLFFDSVDKGHEEISALIMSRSLREIYKGNYEMTKHIKTWQYCCDLEILTCIFKDQNTVIRDLKKTLGGDCLDQSIGDFLSLFDDKKYMAFKYALPM